MLTGLPHREIYWNIPEHTLLYVPFAAMVLVFLYGVSREVACWRLGRREALRPIGPRLRRVLRDGVFQRKVAEKAGSGTAHAVLFLAYGFLTVGTIAVALQADLGIPVLYGPFYLWFESALLDVAGCAATLAVAVFLWRRYVVRRWELRREAVDFWIPFSLLIVLVTGFLLQSLRIYATHDPWGAWSFVGAALARLWGALGMSVATAREVHHALWWFHLVVAFSFMAAWPYSKLMHILTAPLALFYADPEGQPQPPEVAFEGEGRLGANALSDLRVKDLIDLDACTECGRCDAVCPALATGKPLSPRGLILELRRHMRETPHQPLDGRISDETLFACTTCRACMEACPVGIEHVPKILAMRQYRVMELGRGPEDLLGALVGMEERGHPFRGAGALRSEWYRDLSFVREWQPGEKPELLFWVGCAAAFDRRAQGVARAFALLLHHMGRAFWVLGDREVCTGDPARRAGQEYLYRSMAEEAVRLLHEVGASEVVTICPHCLYELKVEYRRFGFQGKVRHHTELLAEALRTGDLVVPDGEGHETLTYHDPCYLGRYGGRVAEPRQVLAEVGAIREMARHGRRSFCCGAGGGHAFMEEEGERINRVRAREALGTGAEVVATACPFCLQMMTDGVKAEGGEEASVRDIAEILWARVGEADKARV